MQAKTSTTQANKRFGSNHSFDKSRNINRAENAYFFACVNEMRMRNDDYQIHHPTEFKEYQDNKGTKELQIRVKKKFNILRDNKKRREQ